MTLVAWITAVFGALVIGVAVSSLLDELLYRAGQLQLRRWSRGSLLRGVVTVLVSGATMALWVWLWLKYVAG